MISSSINPVKLPKTKKTLSTLLTKPSYPTHPSSSQHPNHTNSKTNPPRYPARSNSASSAAGVPLLDDSVTVALGTNGSPGSGVYSVDLNGESSGPKVQELLGRFRKEGVGETFWEHSEGEFRRITGAVAV